MNLPIPPKLPRLSPARRAPAILALLAACVLQQWAASQCLAAQGPAYGVEIRGSGDLTFLLEQNLDLSRHAGDAEVSDDELRRLLATAPRQASSLLATEGYFSAQATTQLRQDGSMRIAEVDVTPGSPTRIDSVALRFAGAITSDAPYGPARIDALRRNWLLAEGMIFRQADWDAAKGALLKDLIERDFPAAAITRSEALIDPARYSAKLEVEVDSGPAFSFGELDIHGLQHYSRELIDRLNPIQPGERFSQDSLNELQSRLQATGYFRSVFATIVPDPAQPQQTPIRVDLSENERRRLALGLGFSTDAGARAQVKWLDRQFLGHDWRLESELRADRETRLANADLYFPARGNGWVPSIGARVERTDSVGEINNKQRLAARFSSSPGIDEQSWGLSLLVDRQLVAGLAPNQRQALVVTHTRSWRRTDSLLAPQEGHVESLEIDAGVNGVGSESNLVRLTGRSTLLRPLGEKWQAVLRVQAGQVLVASRGSVPEDLLFRAGGDQSVRGYAYNSLGVAQGNAVVGGRVMALASAELVYRITPQWGVAVFEDAGNAADSWRGFRLLHGSGIGARWRSPVGPVNLDLAWGHEVRKVRLHFSVGYGF